MNSLPPMFGTINPLKWSKVLQVIVWQISLTGIGIAIILQPWLRAWWVPFNYEADTVYQLVLVKAILTDGWPWFISHLNAPYANFPALAFPQNTTIMYLVFKVLGSVINEPGLLLNSYWLGSILITSLCCHYALKILNVPSLYAYGLSTLYALLPYALMRNTNHIVLTYAFVPLIACYALLILSQRIRSNANPCGIAFSSWILGLTIIVIGFDYIYTAFFACFFLLLAGLLASYQTHTSDFLRMALRCILSIAICVLINQLPTLILWWQDGFPPNMHYKSISDAEVYGLKIRHLLIPPSVMEWFNFEQRHSFLLENENQSANLGWLGAVGYLYGLFLVLTRKQEDDQLAWGAGALILTGTLLATIGGFGVIFNLLFTPDIRAYNRISVFIAFFSFFLFAIFCQKIQAFLEQKYAALQIYHARSLFFKKGLMIFIFTLALLDQGLTAKPFITKYPQDLARAMDEKELIHRLEQQSVLPLIIYQLPETSFPVDPGREKMAPYDHARPYIWSNNSYWSWPSFSHQKSMWVKSIGAEQSADFLKNISLSGFNVIWLDRFGYSKASLTELEKKLRLDLGEPWLKSHSGRYVIYRLDAIRFSEQSAPNVLERAQEQSQLLHPPIAYEFGKGFYPLEYVGAANKIPHYWAQRDAQIVLINFSDQTQKIIFQSQLAYNESGNLTIHFMGRTQFIELKNGKSPLHLEFDLKPNSRTLLNIHYDGIPVTALGDQRKMFLSMTNPRIQLKQNDVRDLKRPASQTMD